MFVKIISCPVVFGRFQASSSYFIITSIDDTTFLSHAACMQISVIFFNMKLHEFSYHFGSNFCNFLKILLIKFCTEAILLWHIKLLTDRKWHLICNLPEISAKSLNNNVPFLYSAYHIQMASLCARGIITPA